MIKKGNMGEELSLQHWQALFDLTKKNGIQQLGGSWHWRIADAKISCSASIYPQHLLVSRPGVFNQEKPQHIGEKLSVSLDPNIETQEILGLLQAHGVSIAQPTLPARRRWRFFKHRR